MKLPISGRSQSGRRADETKNIRVRNAQRHVLVCKWHLTDLLILHNHVRLARQTGNHSNLLSICADDVKPTCAALNNGLQCSL